MHKFQKFKVSSSLLLAGIRDVTRDSGKSYSVHLANSSRETRKQDRLADFSALLLMTCKKLYQHNDKSIEGRSTESTIEQVIQSKKTED
jgi:hypothetical protein